MPAQTRGKITLSSPLFCSVPFSPAFTAKEVAQTFETWNFNCCIEKSASRGEPSVLHFCRRRLKRQPKPTEVWKTLSTATEKWYQCIRPCCPTQKRKSRPDPCYTRVRAHAANAWKHHTGRCCKFLTRDPVSTAELCTFTAKGFIKERCLPQPPGVADRLMEPKGPGWRGRGSQTAGSPRPRPACLPSPAPSFANLMPTKPARDVPLLGSESRSSQPPERFGMEIRNQESRSLLLGMLSLGVQPKFTAA